MGSIVHPMRSKLDVGRTLILFLRCTKWGLPAILLVFIFNIVKTEYPQAKLRSLNFYMPHPLSFLVEIENEQEIDTQRLQHYKRYYHKIVQFMPQMGDGHAMLGYCLFYVGDFKAATDSYLRAVALNDAFFYNYYNLGVLYFKQERYQEAANMLMRAVSKDPVVAIKYMVASKIYQQMLSSLTEKQGVGIQNVRERYRDAFALISITFYRMGRFQDMLEGAKLAVQSDLDTDGQFYYYAGLASHRLKKYNEAAVFLRVSIQKNQSDAESLQLLGLTLQTLGEKEAALQFLKMAKALSVNDESSKLSGEEISLRIF